MRGWVGWSSNSENSSTYLPGGVEMPPCPLINNRLDSTTVIAQVADFDVRLLVHSRRAPANRGLRTKAEAAIASLHTYTS